MIISDRHEFIFIHCRKTAGSSIKVLLAPHLGDSDLMIGSWHDVYDSYGDAVRPNQRFRRDLRHPLVLAYLAAATLRRPGVLRSKQARMRKANTAQKLKYRRALGPNPPHPSAAAVRDFAPGRWSDYFKFCFVRNPYEKVVSDYFWRLHITGSTDISFRDFCRLLATDDGSTSIVERSHDNWPMYTIEDEIAVDYVGRFEDLATDLKSVLDRLGLECSADALPHVKRVREPYSYREWYNAESRAMVEAVYGQEIEAFGYSF